MLVSGYSMRCYHFELVECARKLCLVGVPAFFLWGFYERLMHGLIVCFVSSCLYANYAPYEENDDNILSAVCQLALFFALLASIADMTSLLDALLHVVAGLPLLLGVFYESLDLRRIVASFGAERFLSASLGQLSTVLQRPSVRSSARSSERSSASTPRITQKSASSSDAAQPTCSNASSLGLVAV